MRGINARTGRENGIHQTTRGTGKFRSRLLTESVEGRLLTVEPKVRTACYLDPAIVCNADDPIEDDFLSYLDSHQSVGTVNHLSSSRG